MPNPCPYCARMMDGRRPLHATYPTRDHVIPQALGGERTVMVCRRCNMDKGHAPIQAWQIVLERRHDPRAAHVAAFIQANPWSIAKVVLHTREIKMVRAVPDGRVAYVHPELEGRGRGSHHAICHDCQRIFSTFRQAEKHWRLQHLFVEVT